jgi:hypothetical protein
MEETYRVKVFTPGHMIVFRGVVCRTPAEFKNVRLSEKKVLELQAKAAGLKCETKKESDIYNEDIVIEELDIKTEEKNETIVEELQESSSKTILEKLISENKD